MSPDNSVGIATGYGQDGWGSIPDRCKITFDNVQTGSGAHTASYSYRMALPSGDKADHSPSNAEVKNGELYLYSPTRLNGVVLNGLSAGTTSPFTMGLWFFARTTDKSKVKLSLCLTS
jgi:hypothetical protein